MHKDFEKLMGPEGPLSTAFPGFEVRPGQKEMLEDVWKAFQNNQVALIEAGTGTGKSLAYLIPAIFWAVEKGETIVLSTNTIALQEQLLSKDIPSLLKALNVELKAVLVKGMNNYICRRKLDDAAVERRTLTEREKIELERIEEWLPEALDGSRSSLPFAPLHETWERINAEGENCTHVKCPHYKNCFFFKARQEASSAHLLVTNHHLLFADLAARAETENYTQSCVLPAYFRLVIDEAHHVEEVATEYFADRVSRTGWIRLMGRLLTERGTGKLKTLQQKIMEVYPTVDKGKDVQRWMDQLEIFFPAEKRSLLDFVETTFQAIYQFMMQGEIEEKLRFQDVHLAHPIWKSEIQPVAKELIDKMRQWVQSILGIVSQMEKDGSLASKCEGLFAEISGLCQRLNGSIDNFKAFIFDPLSQQEVRWIERSALSLSLISAQLDVSTFLSESLFQKLSTVILCSATLAANKSFSFIRKQLGIPSGIEKIYESPFDYSQQALLTVPIDMPNPDHPVFIEQAAKNIEAIVEASRGNAFVLFTSYQMLKECKDRLHPFFLEKGYPLFCQGEESRQALLERFRQTKRAILFGTDSFWEGVDVAGDALRCVIITKLPFKVPSDPLFQARSEAILQSGGSPFFEYSLPHAIMKFKQGFGRLIRSSHDHGCVVCLDPRLLKKGYGKLFIKSLPTCQTFFDTSPKIFEYMKSFYQKKHAQKNHTLIHPIT